MFHTATPEDIKSGKVTDVYFDHTRQILEGANIQKDVVMEIRTSRLPSGYEWAILAGVEEAAHLLDGLDCSADWMNEGTLFHADEPVMRLKGNYSAFGHYETALLGLLCEASGIATKAARCKNSAGNRPCISFGARRRHPALAPMVERAAFIGGCDGVASVAAANLIDVPAAGTIPHALVLLVGDTVEATKLFDQFIDPDVHRVALVDTFGDEKFESLRAAEALGDKLYAVRLDTPDSRRGDMLELLREVRWELDLRGFKSVKIFVSGGLDEYAIDELNEVADAYGVGTSITNAPVINFSMDIVEIEGKPIAKRGKRSGMKELWRCEDCGARDVRIHDDAPNPCQCGGTWNPQLKTHYNHGVMTTDLATPPEIRALVLKQLAHL